MNLSVESIVTGPFQENSYFFWYDNSRNTILIDPGDDGYSISKALDQNNLVQTIDPSIIVHSGHGPDTTFKNEVEKNPFLIALNDKLNLQS